MQKSSKIFGRRGLLASSLAAVFAAGASRRARAAETTKTVYHIDDTSVRALRTLRNIRNHLNAEPGAQIIVVTNANGIEFLQQGYKDTEQPDIDYAALVSALAADGVRFEICENTIRGRKLSKDDFVMEADYTPSGVARAAALQYHEGYAYIKP